MFFRSMVKLEDKSDWVKTSFLKWYGDKHQSEKWYSEPSIRGSSLPTFQQFHFLHLQKKEQIKNIQKGRTKVNDTFYLNSKYEDIK